MVTWDDIVKEEDKQKDKSKNWDPISWVIEAVNKTDRREYWIWWDFVDSAKWLLWWLWDLVEYGWTNITNKNEDWWINDYKKYKEYSKKMNESTSEQEYSDTYKKMVSEWVIDEAKYNDYINKQKDWPDYEFTQAKEKWKDIFNKKLEDSLSPIMKQAQNRYQIDAISKWISQIEDQYSMAFENAMNAYNDTRDERILAEWEKMSKEYEDNIIKITKEWWEKIMKWKTYWEAYSETISDYANKQAANDIVSLERAMTNKLYKYTLDRNFDDAWDYLWAGNVLQAINSWLLWLKNTITWWLQQVWFGVEELKEWITGRYDVTEELANLYVFEEDASTWAKAFWTAQWVANWTLDSLPQLAPVAAELFLTRKVPWQLLKTFDKWLDAIHLAEWTSRSWFRNVSRLLTELTMDNLVYDTSFQTIVWHPITGDEENINLLFNWMIDSAQAYLHVPAKFFNQALKKSDIVTNIVSEDVIKLAKKTTKENANLMSEELVLLRWKEITAWTKANKKAQEKFFNLDELKEVDPDLVAKIQKLQKMAWDYAERMAKRQGNLEDLLLTAEDMKGRRQLHKMTELEKIDMAAQKIMKEWKVMRELWDYIFSWAKSIWHTFREMLEDWRLTEEELRNMIKSVTDIDWFDNLIIWLARWDRTLRNTWLAQIEQSGKNLTNANINEIYNSTMLKVLDSKLWDEWEQLLKEWEWIGKFKKIWDNQYIDMYWKNVWYDWEQITNVFTYEQVKDYISSHMYHQTVWAEQWQVSSALISEWRKAMQEIKDGTATFDTKFDATQMFNRIKWFDLWARETKSNAEQELTKQILQWAGFTVKVENWKVLVEWTYDQLNTLFNQIVNLWGKTIDSFKKEDMAAYRLIFFNDIHSSFIDHLLRNKQMYEDFLAKDYVEEFKTFFEKLFKIDKKGNVKLVNSMDDNWLSMFRDMFKNKASFKEIENEAVNNLLRWIIDASKLEWDDKALYKKVKDLICEWRYFKWQLNEENEPIVTALFNQSKWLLDMWLSEKWVDTIIKSFWELIIDDWTIKSLRLIWNDYLYKAIISKLLLGNWWDAIYKDSLTKLFSQLPTNFVKKNGDIKNSITNLTKKIEWLTMEWVTNADKEVLLNQIQKAYEGSKVRYNKNWFKKFAKNENITVVKNKIDISDASKLKDDEIDTLADILSIQIFAKNDLPKSRLMDWLRDSLKNTLKNMREQNVKNIKFTSDQWLTEIEWWINLTLLSEMQLASMLRDPDNMLQLIIGKQFFDKSLNGLELLWEKLDMLWKKNIDNYKEMLTWIRNVLQTDDDYDTLVSNLVKAIDDYKVIDTKYVRTKLNNRLNKASKWDVRWKLDVANEINDSIKRVQTLIDILNVPGSSKEAQFASQRLYEVKQLLYRGKALASSNKSLREIQSELNNTAKNFELLKRPSDISYKWVVTESPTINSIWSKGTNDIFMDDPRDVLWKWLWWKKFLILDTETNWLDDELKKLWGKSEVIQLSYRLIEVDRNWRKKVTKFNESYKFPKIMTEWSKQNAAENFIEEWTKTFAEWEGIKNLQEILKDKNVYFVAHNAKADIGWLKESWIEINEKNIISTDLSSKALIPINKNHSQETLVDAYMPIKNASEKQFAEEYPDLAKNGVKHHNAIRDTLELENVFWYLINHAYKNKKISKENQLLKLFLDTTQWLKKEMDNKQFPTNALPFYRLEDWWSHSRNRQEKWNYKVPTLLNQFFGSRSTRKDLWYMADHINKTFKKKSTVNIKDAIDWIADKLSDEKSVYILWRLKKIVWDNDIIDVNKILIWDEVKDWFIEAQKIFPEMTFSEYCTNRLVANILSTIWKYDNATINSLNALLKWDVRAASIAKYISWWEWTNVYSAAIHLFKTLWDRGFLELWEAWSTEYSQAMLDIVKALWNNPVQLQEYNKYLAKYYKDTTKENLDRLNWAAKDLFDVVFWEDGDATQYTRKLWFADTVWDNKTIYDEEWNEIKPFVNTEVVTPDQMFREDIENLNAEIKRLNEERKAYNAASRKLWDKLRNKEISLEEWKKQYNDLDKAIKLNNKKVYEAQEEIRRIEWYRNKEKIYRKDIKQKVYEEEEEWELSNFIQVQEESDAVDVFNNVVENPWAAETVRVHWGWDEWLLREVSKDLWTIFQSDEFEEKVIWWNALRYSNMFMIDETTESSKQYANSSYNGIIEILRASNWWDEAKLSNYINEQYDTIHKLVSDWWQVEKDYMEVLDKIRNMSSDEVEKYKKKNPKKFANYEKYWQLKSEDSWLYNARMTLAWARRSTSPQELIETEWFNKWIIWQWTASGRIDWVDIRIANVEKWSSKDLNTTSQFYTTEAFDEFDPDGFIQWYIEAFIKKEWKADTYYSKSFVDVVYKVHTLDKDTEIVQRIPADELFKTAVWKYILDRYWFAGKLWWEWYNNTEEALRAIKQSILSNVRILDDWWVKWTKWEQGNWDYWVHNWQKRDEEDFIKWLWFSDQKYVEAFDYLPEEQQNALLKELWVPSPKEFKTRDEFNKEFQNRVDSQIRLWNRSKLDEMYKWDNWNSAEELLYFNKVKPNLNNRKWEFVKWMNAYVKTPSYHRWVNKSSPYRMAYLIDTYIEATDKQLVSTPMSEKILDFNTKDADWVEYKIVAYQPLFYKVENDDDVVWIVEWNFVWSANQEFEELQARGLDDTKWHLEPMKDYDTVTVLVEDSNHNQWIWQLDVWYWMKTWWEKSNIEHKAWTFQLHDLKETTETQTVAVPGKEWYVQTVNKYDLWTPGWTYREPLEWWMVKEWNVWNARVADWSNSEHKIEWRDAWDYTYKYSTDTPKEVVEESKKQADAIDNDIDDLINEVDPFNIQTKKIINSRLLNFTNYDIVEQSPELKEIVWMRQTFLAENWEKLRAAIDVFEKEMENFTDEEQKLIYSKIRWAAQDKLKTFTDADYQKGWIANMPVHWVKKEVVDALNNIWKVFSDAWWTPQIQYMMLSKENDGFEWILKNLVHNHKWTAAQKFRVTWQELKVKVEWTLKEYASGKRLKNLVEDVLWDPLGTWTMNKLFMSLRSMWRFVKYWPVLFPLSWVMMLANSAILWITRYWSESAGFRWIMRNPAFDRLITKRWDKLADGKVWLWLTDWINRVNEIMFNSNSDLGWTWFDKCLDWMIDFIPSSNPVLQKTKEVAATAMKWGTHSLFDLFAQWSVKAMELAKALEKNLTWVMSLEEFVELYEKWIINKQYPDLLNKILADTEKWYSRFFTNSATSLFSRHRFSRWYMFNALQWYVINRTDEVFWSIKDFINWMWRQYQVTHMWKKIDWVNMWVGFNWKDFVNYINTENQELKWLLMNVLLSAKIGFYMDRLVNWWDFSPKEYSDYMIDTSDYLSSLPATFFYSILTAPIAGIEDYSEYVKANNEDFSLWDWLTVASMNTVSQVFNKLFREGKVATAFADSIVSYWKYWNVDFSIDVLRDELESIANWLWRFQLVEWTNKYWLDNLTSERDLLWQILFNSDKVSNAGQITQNMYSLQNVDSILNWEAWDWRKDKLLPYVPVIGNLLKDSVTGWWYNFTQTKWNELQHIMDTDKVVRVLNNWDYETMDQYKDIWWDEWIYTTDAVDRMYKELTAFNYPYKGRKDWTEFVTWYPGELEPIKETVFTDEILRGLWRTDEDLAKYLNTAADRKWAWLLKIMAAWEASRPWSSKIILSYLANQEEYKLMQKVSGKAYPSTNDLTEEEMEVIKRQVLEDYYPYMFTADKTSWYKAITEYVSNKYPIFDTLYKDDDLTGYLSTLWYMDMIMYQQAKEWNVNAKYIKNSRSMLSKYFKSEPARLNAISYTMWSIENSWFSRGKATAAKMWVLAANMDFYDRIQKSWMMQSLYWDDIEQYNQFVWWVLKDINDLDLDLSSPSWKRTWKKKNNYYNNGWVWDNNVPMIQQFVPQAQKYLNGWQPKWVWAAYKYNPKTYQPEDLKRYRNYYEGLIKDYSDKLVRQKSKTYPAQYTEPITYKRQLNNRWTIRANRLSFPKHKSKEFRTNVISNLPGAHG